MFNVTYTGNTNTPDPFMVYLNSDDATYPTRMNMDKTGGKEITADCQWEFQPPRPLPEGAKTFMQLTDVDIPPDSFSVRAGINDCLYIQLYAEEDFVDELGQPCPVLKDFIVLEVYVPEGVYTQPGSKLPSETGMPRQFVNAKTGFLNYFRDDYFMHGIDKWDLVNSFPTINSFPDAYYEVHNQQSDGFDKVISYAIRDAFIRAMNEKGLEEGWLKRLASVVNYAPRREWIGYGGYPVPLMGDDFFKLPQGLDTGDPLYPGTPQFMAHKIPAPTPGKVISQTWAVPMPTGSTDGSTDSTAASGFTGERTSYKYGIDEDPGAWNGGAPTYEKQPLKRNQATNPKMGSYRGEENTQKDTCWQLPYFCFLVCKYDDAKDRFAFNLLGRTQRRNKWAHSPKFPPKWRQPMYDPAGPYTTSDYYVDGIEHRDPYSGCYIVDMANMGDTYNPVFGPYMVPDQRGIGSEEINSYINTDGIFGWYRTNGWWPSTGGNVLKPGAAYNGQPDKSWTTGGMFGCNEYTQWDPGVDEDGNVTKGIDKRDWSKIYGDEEVPVNCRTPFGLSSINIMPHGVPFTGIDGIKRNTKDRSMNKLLGFTETDDCIVTFKTTMANLKAINQINSHHASDTGNVITEGFIHKGPHFGNPLPMTSPLPIGDPTIGDLSDEASYLDAYEYHEGAAKRPMNWAFFQWSSHLGYIDATGDDVQETGEPVPIYCDMSGTIYAKGKDENDSKNPLLQTVHVKRLYAPNAPQLTVSGGSQCYVRCNLAEGRSYNSLNYTDKAGTPHQFVTAGNVIGMARSANHNVPMTVPVGSTRPISIEGGEISRLRLTLTDAEGFLLENAGSWTATLSFCHAPINPYQGVLPQYAQQLIGNAAMHPSPATQQIMQAQAARDQNLALQQQELLKMQQKQQAKKKKPKKPTANRKKKKRERKKRKKAAKKQPQQPPVPINPDVGLLPLYAAPTIH